MPIDLRRDVPQRIRRAEKPKRRVDLLLGDGMSRSCERNLLFRNLHTSKGELGRAQDVWSNEANQPLLKCSRVVNRLCHWFFLRPKRDAWMKGRPSRAALRPGSRSDRREALTEREERVLEGSPPSSPRRTEETGVVHRIEKTRYRLRGPSEVFLARGRSDSHPRESR